MHDISLKNSLEEQGFTLPYSEDFSSYHTPLLLYGRKISNRIGIQPLEGFDSAPGGEPTDMVRRRYLRFVKGGAGLIWFEACAVSEDGKSNPYQMALTDDNVSDFQELLQLMNPGHTHAGCIVKDREMYFPLYQKYVLKK